MAVEFNEEHYIKFIKQTKRIRGIFYAISGVVAAHVIWVWLVLWPRFTAVEQNVWYGKPRSFEEIVELQSDHMKMKEELKNINDVLTSAGYTLSFTRPYMLEGLQGVENIQLRKQELPTYENTPPDND